MMLQRRSRSPAAIRARARRARQRAGIEFDLTTRTHTRRLVAAMHAAARADGRRLDDDMTRAAIERELTAIAESFVARWIGPAKKN
jgi:uncharacterized membrane protein YebE (DUF533 family)